MNTDDGSALYHGEYRPYPSEFLATGVIGIILYISIAIAAIYLLTQSKTFLNRLFYVSMTMMAIFDMPRYFILAIESSYHSKIGYSMHIISGAFYFICLAIIGMTFATILEVGSLSFTMIIYSKRGLSLAVLLHTAVDFSAFIICLKSRSLSEFFGSQYYIFFMCFDILQNFLYSSVLVLFGLRLISR